MTTPIILGICEIFGIFAIGWYARHRGYIREEELGRWSGLVIDFFMPMLIFHSVVSGFETDRLGELWPLPAIGFGMMAVGGLLGFFLRKGLKSKDPGVVRTFHHFCAINNYSFLPILLVQNLWGSSAALARLFFLNLGSTLGFWTIGIALLGGGEIRRTLKNIFSVNLAALFAALLISALGWQDHVPVIAMKITGSLGAVAVPMILVLIGATLYPFPSFPEKRDLAYLSLVRLVLLPVAILGILALFPLHADVRGIALIVALMPTSVSSTVVTRLYGGSPEFAVRAAVVTTLASIVTVPLGVWLLWG
jgi:malate permease and related proteins